MTAPLFLPKSDHTLPAQMYSSSLRSDLSRTFGSSIPAPICLGVGDESTLPLMWASSKFGAVPTATVAPDSSRVEGGTGLGRHEACLWGQVPHPQKILHRNNV